MKENLFHMTLPDGQVKVVAPDYNVMGIGDNLKEACDDFIRAWRSKYVNDPKLYESDTGLEYVHRG